MGSRARKANCEVFVSVSLCVHVLSRVRLFVISWTIAHLALSMGYWSGLPFPTPGDLPNSGIEPVFLASPALGGGFFISRLKEMETHSSILAWRIPWMEDPGGLQSMGLQRV